MDYGPVQQEESHSLRHCGLTITSMPCMFWLQHRYGILTNIIYYLVCVNFEFGSKILIDTHCPNLCCSQLLLNAQYLTHSSPSSLPHPTPPTATPPPPVHREYVLATSFKGVSF